MFGFNGNQDVTFVTHEARFSNQARPRRSWADAGATVSTRGNQQEAAVDHRERRQSKVRHTGRHRRGAACASAPHDSGRDVGCRPIGAERRCGSGARDRRQNRDSDLRLTQSAPDAGPCDRWPWRCGMGCRLNLANRRVRKGRTTGISRPDGGSASSEWCVYTGSGSSAEPTTSCAEARR